ncbi:MAG: hypothetical protein ACM3UW_07330 [Bacillota bacterium]
MPKKIVLCLLVFILSAVLLLAGCGGGTKTEQASSDPASSDKGGELSELFAKAATVDELYYEFVITEGEREEARGKAWVKEPRMKQEMTVNDETIISIFDNAKAENLVYIEGTDMATLTTFDPQGLGAYDSPTNYSDDLDLSSMKIVGAETYDGHKCKVIAITDEQGQETAKMWVSEQYGIPLRIEDGIAGVTIEYKNLKVGSIPDDVFELPPGVKIMENR